VSTAATLAANARATEQRVVAFFAARGLRPSPRAYGACARVVAGRRCGLSSGTYSCECQQFHRLFDHGRTWLDPAGHRVISGEPYGIDDEVLRRFQQQVADPLDLVVSTEPNSPWFPGHTSLVLVQRRTSTAKEHVMRIVPPSAPPKPPRLQMEQRQIYEALGAAREHGHVIEVEFYCERPACAAREIRVTLKDHDSNLVPHMAHHVVACPICSHPVKVHWVRSAHDQARHDEALARSSVNTQMFLRDLPPDELGAVPASVLCDERLPPTPPGWFDDAPPPEPKPTRVFRSKSRTE
jgi:hypothetical protein